MGQVTVDRAREHVEVDDRAVRVRSQIDDHGHRWGICVAGDDQFAGNDDRRIARLVEDVHA